MTYTIINEEAQKAVDRFNDRRDDGSRKRRLHLSLSSWENTIRTLKVDTYSDGGQPAAKELRRFAEDAAEAQKLVDILSDYQETFCQTAADEAAVNEIAIRLLDDAEDDTDDGTLRWDYGYETTAAQTAADATTLAAIYYHYADSKSDTAEAIRVAACEAANNLNKIAEAKHWLDGARQAEAEDCDDWYKLHNASNHASDCLSALTDLLRHAADNAEAEAADAISKLYRD